jgi:translocation and assembly module TamB
LTQPADLAFSPRGLELASACLVQLEASVCGAARIGTDDDFADLELTAFDLAVLEPLLGNSFSATGIYDAQVKLSGALSRPAGTVSLRGSATTITIREADSQPLEVQVEDVTLDAVLSSAGQLAVDGGLTGENDARIAVTATIANVWAVEPTLSADVSGFWGDVSLLSLLSPDVGEVRGTANVDLNFSGPLRAPEVRGGARWSAGQLAVPRWGLLIEGIEAEASSSGGEQLVIRATGQVGDGQIEVDGFTQLDSAARWPTELSIRGERLQAVRIPEADIVISPDLTVQVALPNLEVSGTVGIPYGRILFEALPPQAVEASPDVVVHGIDAVEERDRPIQMRADIQVALGDDVRYAGQGLDVGLSGAIRLLYQSGRDAVASGALNLSGAYSAYGQTLQIDQGRLLFTGPLGNPTLDVRAVRRVDDITAGVQLAGTVNAPVTRVFSEPSMSEADALSYVLFGRSLSNSEAQETATLESAAVSMGLRQALPIIQRVGETLGLDELSVQSTTTDTGELMAGKQISPRLYIRYSYGLFNRIGGLLMRFSLSERLSLETRSGDNRAMDLIYTVERE